MQDALEQKLGGYLEKKLASLIPMQDYNYLCSSVRIYTQEQKGDKKKQCILEMHSY